MVICQIEKKLNLYNYFLFIFFAGCLQDIPENFSQITYSLLFAIRFIAANKLYSVNVTNATLRADFSDLFAQLLYSIRTLLSWSSILQSENELRPIIESCSQILLIPSAIPQKSKIVAVAIGKIYNFSVQRIVYRISLRFTAQLLLSISNVLRPRFMLECPGIRQLIQSSSTSSHFDKQIALYVQNMAVNCFVLPWLNMPPAAQEFEKRAIALHTFIQNLAQDLLNVDDTTAYSQQDKVIKFLDTAILH